MLHKPSVQRKDTTPTGIFFFFTTVVAPVPAPVAVAAAAAVCSRSVPGMVRASSRVSRLPAGDEGG